jgi:NAD(P)-dependent dehydrogenase (short-subunit alcohol dehydrogenase family)
VIGAVDRAMDLAVVPGFTSIGYRIRSRSWAQLDVGAALGDRDVIVTGATSGLGFAAAERLARAGARVHLVARDPARGAATRALLAERTGSDQLFLHACDVSDLGSVREFAARFEREHGIVAVLVNNAGVLLGERRRSVDGFELTFATNLLGPFLLTNLLVPALRRGRPARVINVSSGGMYTARIDVEDLQLERRRFDGPAFYAHTKRAQVILTELWAERLAGEGIGVHAMHPGWADTPGVASSLPRFHRLMAPLLRDADQGADTIVWLAAAAEPAGRPGELWQDRAVRPKHRLPGTRESRAERAALWRELCRLSGWDEEAWASPRTRRGADLDADSRAPAGRG